MYMHMYSDCLVCAVLLCLVICLILLASFFLSFSSLILNMYIIQVYMYVFITHVPALLCIHVCLCGFASFCMGSHVFAHYCVCAQKRASCEYIQNADIFCSRIFMIFYIYK